MKKCNVVKDSKDFEKIIKTGLYVKNSNLVIYYQKNELNKDRFGISVGKKIGNAVIRNKYKRKLRNIVDNQEKLYSKNKDYIIMLRKNCLDLEYNEIEKSYIELFKKISSREGIKYETK